MGLVETATKCGLHTNAVRPTTTADLVSAQEQPRPSVDDWLATARNYGTYANATGFYDKLMAYIRSRKRR